MSTELSNLKVMRQKGEEPIYLFKKWKRKVIINLSLHLSLLAFRKLILGLGSFFIRTCEPSSEWDKAWFHRSPVCCALFSLFREQPEGLEVGLKASSKCAS